jgi:hypothetical protein
MSKLDWVGLNLAAWWRAMIADMRADFVESVFGHGWHHLAHRREAAKRRAKKAVRNV